MNKLPTAFFVEYPFTIEDLIKPHLLKQQKSYIVEKEICLSKIDYENLITDLCVDRWFIEKYSYLCKIDEDGVWHSILARQREKTDGILIMPDGRVFPKWAAYTQWEVTEDE